MIYVVIRSSHVLSGTTSRTGMLQTLCGRWVRPETAQRDTLPAGRSCESCLRAVARRDA